MVNFALRITFMTMIAVATKPDIVWLVTAFLGVIGYTEAHLYKIKKEEEIK